MLDRSGRGPAHGSTRWEPVGTPPGSRSACYQNVALPPRIARNTPTPNLRSGRASRSPCAKSVRGAGVLLFLLAGRSACGRAALTETSDAIRRPAPAPARPNPERETGAAVPGCVVIGPVWRVAAPAFSPHARATRPRHGPADLVAGCLEAMEASSSGLRGPACETMSDAALRPPDVESRGGAAISAPVPDPKQTIDSRGPRAGAGFPRRRPYSLAWPAPLTIPQFPNTLGRICLQTLAHAVEYVRPAEGQGLLSPPVSPPATIAVWQGTHVACA